MGNRWGAGKENGEGRGGGRSVYKQPRPRVDGDRTTRKGGFQVSKRDSGIGEGFSRWRVIIRGDRQGVSRVLCQVLLYNVNPVHIVVIVCMSC
jgi:hypothetical protein